MVPANIKSYCLEHGYQIKDIKNGKKSIVIFLEKNQEQFVLKKLLVSETENINLKFDNEINCIKRIHDMSNKSVKAATIIDVVQDSQYYIVNRIDGVTLHQFMGNPIANRYDILKIHHVMFQWFQDWYDQYEKQHDSLKIKSTMKDGPYSKKMVDILDNEMTELQITRLLRMNPLPISRVHGDLVPWNIIVGKNQQLYVLDWANSGTDFPAHDLTRYLLQIMKKIDTRQLKREFFDLFWSYFDYLFSSSPRSFQMILLFHYHYSKRILLKKTSSSMLNFPAIKKLRNLRLYTAYRSIDYMINRYKI